MSQNIRQIPLVFGLMLALLLPAAALAAGKQEAQSPLALKAVAFVRTLAQGQFTAAESDFTGQMKQAAPPQRLGEVWQQLISRVGPFQGTGDSKTVVREGLTTVIVRADFKNEAIGIAVTFDSASRIAGMHFVPPP